VKGKPLNFEKKYTLATKAYIAQGHDGYDSLTGSRIIVDEENARLLPAIVCLICLMLIYIPTG